MHAGACDVGNHARTSSIRDKVLEVDLQVVRFTVGHRHVVSFKVFDKSANVMAKCLAFFGRLRLVRVQRVRHPITGPFARLRILVLNGFNFG